MTQERVIIQLNYYTRKKTSPRSVIEPSRLSLTYPRAGALPQNNRGRIFSPFKNIQFSTINLLSFLFRKLYSVSVSGLQINLAYDCLTHCPSPHPPCQRGGYVNPNNCSACLCPDGLAGVHCANIRLSNANCGGVLKVILIFYSLSHFVWLTFSTKASFE